MSLTDERKSLLWLSAAEIAAGRARALMAEYGGAQGVREAFGSPGGPSFQPNARKTLERLRSDAALDDLAGKLAQKNVRLLFQGDGDYPPQLEAIDDAPYLLYYAGSLSCLDMPAVALVGTRRASAYGLEMARTLARGLCEAGVCVVSGLARGIDAAAHQGALDAGGRTVGVMGSGLNVPYPPEHTPLLRKIAGGIGLVLSEYPLDAEPVPYHFPHRNRLISGLSRAVVFVEGRIKSGGTLTVDAALRQGREVFAVPGRVGTEGAEGPHIILREGGRPATCAQDILEDLGLCAPACAPRRGGEVSLTPLMRDIVRLLRVEPLGAQALCERLGLGSGELLGALGEMEIMGVIGREAGNIYCLSMQAGI